MKAVIMREPGSLAGVRIEDIPGPRRGPNEILVEVRAAALNHLDLWVIRGRDSDHRPDPHVLGADAAGVVLEADPGVEGVAVGSEVILNPGLSCGQCEFCRQGEQSLCVSYGILGLSRSGAFAQRIAVPARNVHPKPTHLDFVQAAALPLDHLTAWRMLFTRGGLTAGQTVLIHGIGGGVALAALQLAKLCGAMVVVTSSSDEKLRRACKQFGADHAVNYRAGTDIGDEVRALTGGRGVDLVIDSVGAATWPINEKAVRRGGTIVLCGVTGGAEARINLQKVYWNQFRVLGSTMGSDEDFRRMLAAVTQNRLVPVVDSVLPLERAGEAFRRMEQNQQFGKIVVTP